MTEEIKVTVCAKNGEEVLSTLSRELGRLAECDTGRRDAGLDQIAAMLEDNIDGRRVVVNEPYEAIVISDLFFNSDLAEHLRYVEGEFVGLESAAQQFHDALWPNYRDKYSVEWLCDNFLNRV